MSMLWFRNNYINKIKWFKERETMDIKRLYGESEIEYIARMYKNKMRQRGQGMDTEEACIS